MSHAELVELAKRWLWRKCSIVSTEPRGSGREEPDALGWYGSGGSILIECKVSRTDFRKDLRKSSRHYPENGVGQQRYYLTTQGIAKPDELPGGWGLIEWNGRHFRKLAESEYFSCPTRNEVEILMSLIRKIGQNAPEGVSIKFYVHETKNKATLGISAKPLSKKLEAVIKRGPQRCWYCGNEFVAETWTDGKDNYAMCETHAATTRMAIWLRSKGEDQRANEFDKHIGIETNPKLAKWISPSPEQP